VKKKVSLGRKLAFASADLFGGGSFNIINFLYPGFLALVVGINPFWSGFIILVSRVFDAIIDPFIGWLSDQTQSRFGKRRVYLIFVSPFIVLGMFLVFYPYQFEDELARVGAVLVSYLTFVAIQSSVLVPYTSLSGEISPDYQQRASFNSYRRGFSIFSSILCVVLPGIIVRSFDTPLIGYQVMSLTFGVFFGISVLITGLFSKEVIESPVVKEKYSFRALFSSLNIKAFRQYSIMSVVTQMTMAIMSGLFFFYVSFYVVKDVTAGGGTSSVGLIGAALMFATQIVVLPMYTRLIAKKGKTYVYRLGSFIWIVAALCVLLIPANVNPLFIYLLATFLGVGISAPAVVPFAMFGDVVDVGQLKYKKRVGGNMGGFINFTNQIGAAVGISVSMVILGFAGFTEQDLALPPITSQPESALWAIRLVFSLAPLLLMGIGVLTSYQYKIDAKRHQEINDAIRAGDANLKNFSDVL
jgi:oligogalacturonide transporter